MVKNEFQNSLRDANDANVVMSFGALDAIPALHADYSCLDEKIFQAKKENVPDMLSFLETFSERCHLPMDFSIKLSIVGDEIFSNIIWHGYEDRGGEIFVRALYDESKKEFVLFIVDAAKPFNQLSVENGPVNGDTKDIKIGGLGLLIVKKLMDECAYDLIDGKNVLSFKKHFA